MNRAWAARSLIAAIVGFVMLSMLTWLWSRGTRPDHVHTPLTDLPLCPSSPNCVCSRTDPTDTTHAIAPIPFTGDPQAALQRLKTIVESLPRTKIVSASDRYLHAECTSRLFRFVDDLECLIDPSARLIHIRSASRVGHSDLGVNRQRVETIREQFSSSEQSSRRIAP